MIRNLSYIIALAISMFTSFSLYGEGSEHPFRGEVLRGYDEASTRERCDAMDLQPLEGLWFYPDENMTVMIERCDDSVPLDYREYRLVLVSADDLSLLPGTVIGYCKPTVDADVFKLWLYAEQKNEILENPQLCKATLNSSHDEFVVERSKFDFKLRVNFSRFLPKLLKGITISTSGVDKVEIPEGFRKVYPKTKSRGVRYL